MDETKYFVAECAHCANHIEFPESGLGLMVDCPHCGQRTQLRAAKKPAAPEPETSPPDESPVPPPSRGKTIAVVGLLCLILATIAVGVVVWKKSGPKPDDAALPQAPVHADTNVSIAPTTNTTAARNPPATPRPKALSDLKVGEIQLDKTKGSSLVYATGKLQNDSDYQRFGVRVELDVFNPAGDKIGTAKDYLGILEPRKTWSFRALVTDSKAASAKLATVKEDE